jgi:drug/metabolite transporter (DMT)-like permease
MGAVFALVCAVFWAVAVILFKRSGETVPPFALNLFRVTVSTPLLIATVWARGLPLVRPAPAADYWFLVASGVIGIAVADTLFHWSLNRVGAGITAIIDTFYSPMVVFLAFVLIGERIGLRDFAGMGLIMGAVLLSGTLKPPAGCTRKMLIEGIVLGLLGLSFLSFGIVVAKPVIDHSPVLWVAAVRQAASATVLLAAALISPRRWEHFAVLRPSRSWRWMVPGTIMGSYLSLIFWLAAMKYALASVAAILTQSSTLFILLFAVLFLREPMTRRKALSALLALAGVLLVSTR